MNSKIIHTVCVSMTAQKIWSLRAMKINFEYEVNDMHTTTNPVSNRID